MYLFGKKAFSFQIMMSFSVAEAAVLSPKHESKRVVRAPRKGPSGCSIQTLR